MESEGLLPCSQRPATDFLLESCQNPSIIISRISVLISSSHLRYDLASGPFKFWNYNSVYISHPSMRATCPADPIILDMITITVNLFGGVKSYEEWGAS
jgi:hypothetical protein